MFPLRLLSSSSPHQLNTAAEEDYVCVSENQVHERRCWIVCIHNELLHLPKSHCNGSCSIRVRFQVNRTNDTKLEECDAAHLHHLQPLVL